jgi:hypothetical protein
LNKNTLQSIKHYEWCDAIFTMYLALSSQMEYIAGSEALKSTHQHANFNKIVWIEKLLQTPIQDHRKFTVWRILAPYLLNKSGLSFEESFSVIKGWLDKCNKIERFDFDANQKKRSFIIVFHYYF